MYATLGWLFLAGLPLSTPAARTGGQSPTTVGAARVAVWTDRDEPYRRGQPARVYLRPEEPTHVAVLRVDTDGRIRVLFPREPWNDTWVDDRGDLEIAALGGRNFTVDDDPGIGYLFALSSSEPLDFRVIARAGHWDYRMLEGGRITGDPYLALTDIAARLAPGGDYDYDISPYYVDKRYEYPRFVCYDCHAYAGYDEWDPYRRACARFRVVIYDDPRYYPYRAGRGRNVVVQRPRSPEPRFVFRDADPDHEYVTRVATGRAGDHRRREALGRTSRDVGGRGTVPAPEAPAATPRSLGPSGEPERDPLIRRRQPGRPPAPADRSTGEPELRRRKP